MKKKKEMYVKSFRPQQQRFVKKAKAKDLEEVSGFNLISMDSGILLQK